jgi:hypothetical protein
MSKRSWAVFLLPALLFAVPSIPAVGADGTVIHLFNGKDLTNFYSYLGSPGRGEKALGKNNDPKGVFKVEDGVLHGSGEVYGYVATEQEYENYHLTVEFKWGENTWPPRKDKARDSGVLIHASGPDKVWPHCIECQMIEGGTCDLLLVPTKDRPIKLTAPVEQRGKETWYTPGSPEREFSSTGIVRINWFGRDPNWKDVVGVRGPKDVERPLGEWNVIEVTCDGPSINYKLNGVEMNAAKNSSLTKGRILLQSEGAEVYFRKVDLRPLR